MEPLAIAVKSPVVLIVPGAVGVLDHVPPVGPLAYVVVVPVHTVAGPVIGSGRGLTVTSRVAVQVVADDV